MSEPPVDNAMHIGDPEALLDSFRVQIKTEGEIPAESARFKKPLQKPRNQGKKR